MGEKSHTRLSICGIKVLIKTEANKSGMQRYSFTCILKSLEVCPFKKAAYFINEIVLDIFYLALN